MKNIAFVYSGFSNTFHLYNYTNEGSLKYKLFAQHGGIDFLVEEKETDQTCTALNIPQHSRVDVTNSQGVNVLTGYF